MVTLESQGLIIEYVVLFLVSIIFIESITSAFEIMYISFKTPLQAGDTTSLAGLTRLIPAQAMGNTILCPSFIFWLVSHEKFQTYLIA